MRSSVLWIADYIGVFEEFTIKESDFGSCFDISDDHENTDIARISQDTAW